MSTLDNAGNRAPVPVPQPTPQDREGTPRCANCGDLLRATNFYDGPGWTHERGSSQCRIFARAPEGTPFPPYYAALVKAQS